MRVLLSNSTWKKEWASPRSEIRWPGNTASMPGMGPHSPETCEANNLGSKSQYETQFKKWGLRKNHTSAVWKTIAQILQSRRSLGKKTSVFFDGHLIPEVRVQREISRHDSLAIRNRRKQGISSSCDLTCWSSRRLITTCQNTTQSCLRFRPGIPSARHHQKDLARVRVATCQLYGYSKL